MRIALVTGALLLALASSAAAAPGQGGWTDPVGDNGYNAPDVHTVAAMWDGEMLAFGYDVTQTGTYSGDRFSVQVDADRDGVADYMLMLQCCEVSRWMGAWNGVGWNIDTPQSTFQASFASGRVQMYVNRAQVGAPAGTLHFRVQTLFAAISSWDLAPDAGWYVLPQETEVAGASGPGEPGTAPAPAGPAPATQPPPPAPAPRIDPTRGRRAIRALVRRKLGRRARVTRLACDAAMRCRVHARRGAWRYAGTATVRVLESGAYRATFSGTRSKRGCGRRCRSRVRW